MIEITDKQALLKWEEFLESIRNSTPIDINETKEAKAARIKRLEADPEEWFKYYFPKYCFCDPAPFHVASTERLFAKSRIQQSRAWARGLSKSTRRMFEVFYDSFALKCRTNLLLVSKTETNAMRLLAPYKANLEANARLINDYGVQEKLGSWNDYEFITRSGKAFRAVGAEQNPRGAKLEELRPNKIIFDDLDDDEVCRNPDRVIVRFNWCQEAVIPTVDISSDYWICWDNNIIADDSCAVRAQEFSTDVEMINIRDEFGKSTWPAKNKEEDIDYMLSIISYESAQKEYFNNPMSNGKTFPEMTYGKCPPLEDLEFVMVYADPSPSNRDKPTIKSKQMHSGKCVAVIGGIGTKFYVYKVWLDHTKNSVFVEWLYQSREYIDGKTAAFFYIENNTLQNPHYEQVLLPLIYEMGKEYGDLLGIAPDTRDKPDKWFRIEGTLEPINRMGNLILNVEEKNNPHMKRLEKQFTSASATSKLLDGPDTIEGGVHLIKNRMAMEQSGNIHSFKRRPTNKF